ncbi:D-alanyl-D-alanine carboxypeptidase [Amycolatopsis xylanica]|uniref:D-alanyl-D-alanine carboxypeptidase n=1 Tax=Amycolatopsis xylanica TaxID=589385 RepID=A0A1H3E0T1_9PSEU|nr:serine hydrolase domain-containing protein [Amycolatopsis xylanica]SDX72266.1 D-alanyl-D-alanine carboxypeptidase [Amycolatopsis xylanica]
MRMSLPCKRIAASAGIVALLAATMAGPAAATGHRPVQRALDSVVAAGTPGAQVTTRGYSLRSGVGDVNTGAPMPWHSHFRAGSVTKPFVAVLVLQLVGESKVALDAPVTRYLPEANTGAVTVRQILQHTSGLPDYLDEFRDVDLETVRHRGAEPAELLALAMKHPPLFPPGAKWSYSNTNYVLAGMLIERVTGRKVQAEMSARILRPLGLRDTYLPVRGDERLPAPHPRGYLPAKGSLVDFTEFDATIAWAAGGLVTSGEDLNRFFTALLAGRLLRPAELAEMKRTVPSWEGAEYGLGLGRLTMSCGKDFWGHGGDIPGFATLALAAPDGRAVTVEANRDPVTPEIHANMQATLDAALCAK